MEVAASRLALGSRRYGWRVDVLPKMVVSSGVA